MARIIDEKNESYREQREEDSKENRYELTGIIRKIRAYGSICL